MKLTATFTIKLSSPFFFVGCVEKISFNIGLNNFDDTVILVPIEKGHEIKSPGDKWPTYCSDKLILSVSAEEGTPPPAKIKEDGIRNDEAIVAYLDERMEKYTNQAKLLVERLTLFFKYECRNPLLNTNELDIAGLYNPVWTDESGQTIEPTRRCFVLDEIKGFKPDSRYGAHPLNSNNVDKLKMCIMNQRNVELYEELLSDAQAAILQNNHRRALLELAIACEVAIKQKFFMKKTPAGDVFEYLEDSRRVQISVAELVHGAAKHAFSVSFKEEHPLDYQNIDFLFRCRNKIAHKGEIKYKDDTGAMQNVDDATIENWWKSTETLLNWLKGI